MRWLLALVLSCFSLAGQAQAAEPVDIAIVVSLDRSESIDVLDAVAQIDGLVFTLRHDRFRDFVAVGWHGSIALTVVTWSSFGRHEVILPWMRIAGGGDADIAAAILELDPVPEWGGQPVRMMQEEEAEVAADGTVRWVLRRQTELHLIR